MYLEAGWLPDVLATGSNSFQNFQTYKELEDQGMICHPKK